MKSILIIDDETDVRDALDKVLTRAGYAVRQAGDVESALAACDAETPDVVITDIIMPKVSGVSAIESLRSRFPAIKIIAISGGGTFAANGYKPGAIATTAYLAAARRAGADAIITKPFERKELLEALRRLGVGAIK